MLRSHSLRFISLFILLLCAALPASAQKDTGSILGTVKDPSGAVIVGARVTVTDADRGTNLVVTTNESGDYVASPLKIGTYQITVEKAGFKKAVAGPVTVNVQSRVSNDVTLEVGQPDEIVNVKATAPLLETDVLPKQINACLVVGLSLNYIRARINVVNLMVVRNKRNNLFGPDKLAVYH